MYRALGKYIKKQERDSPVATVAAVAAVAAALRNGLQQAAFYTTKNDFISNIGCQKKLRSRICAPKLIRVGLGFLCQTRKYVYVHKLRN